MNEKILNELLARAVRTGDVNLELDDSVVDGLLKQTYPELPNFIKKQAKDKFRVRLQDAAIARAKEAVSPKSMSLGRFLEAVRAKANLTRLDIGVRLQKSDEYVQRLERGDLSPAELPTRDLADVVELFRLVVTMVAEMIMVSVETMSTKQNIRASARSHGGVRHDIRGEDVERALDAFARKLASKSSRANAESKELETCMSNLREELQRRGRVELLK
jgi:transcriptional regulator with XRE-family HTH domain